jgi:hypothetical protein
VTGTYKIVRIINKYIKFHTVIQQEIRKLFLNNRSFFVGDAIIGFCNFFLFRSRQKFDIIFEKHSTVLFKKFGAV